MGFITSRVDEDAFPGLIIQEIGIFLEGIENKFFYGDHAVDAILFMAKVSELGEMIKEH